MLKCKLSLWTFLFLSWIIQIHIWYKISISCNSFCLALNIKCILALLSIFLKQHLHGKIYLQKYYLSWRKLHKKNIFCSLETLYAFFSWEYYTLQTQRTCLISEVSFVGNWVTLYLRTIFMNTNACWNRFISPKNYFFNVMSNADAYVKKKSL